jgi:predicted membrane protein
VAHAIATQQGGGRVTGSVATAAQAAFVSALNEILIIGAVIAFAGAVVGLLLVRSTDFEHGAEPVPAAA